MRRFEGEPGGERVIALARPGVDLYAEVERTLRAEQIEVHEISRERGRLDDVFRRLTRPETAAHPATANAADAAP